MPSSHQARLTALAVAYEANVPVLIWGLPGEGKTAAITTFAKDREVGCSVLVISQRDPTDINGLPIVNEEGTVEIQPPKWLRDANANPGSIVLFDELNLGSPATRGVSLRIVNERVAGDTALHPSIRIIAIANPPEVAEDGWELGAPMSNRFLHLHDWALDQSSFAAGLLSGSWPQVPVLEIPDEALIRFREEASSAVAALVQASPDLLSQVPDSAYERQYAWPSPRSWSLCTELVAHALAAGIGLADEALTILVEGAVGQVAGAQLLDLMRTLRLPSPEEILAAPDGWAVPARADQTWATLLRLLSHLQRSSAPMESWRDGGAAIAHAASRHPDVGVSVAYTWYEQAMSFGPAVLPKGFDTSRLGAVLSVLSER